MHKLVYTVFKTLMVAMIFVFVFDMASYMYRAMSINQRMESIMTSMQKVVMENNYLPEDSYKMYKSLLVQLTNDMNGKSGSTLVMRGADDYNWFVDAIDLNYDNAAVGTLTALSALKYNPATGSSANENILRTQMNLPADYGDVMVVQARVIIEQPTWFMPSGSSADGLTRGLRTTTLKYTYYVPCLKYQSVTQ